MLVVEKAALRVQHLRAGENADRDEKGGKVGLALAREEGLRIEVEPLVVGAEACVMV